MELPGETKGNIVQVIESSGKDFSLLHTECRTATLLGGFECGVLYFFQNLQSGINLNLLVFFLKLYVDIY
jgi:hypothetical protein